jgi:hypothetical protein
MAEETPETSEKSMEPPTEADKLAVFAFFATLLLSCHFGPENIEYVSSGNEAMIKEISRDVVSGMGKEYSEVMAVLRSKVPDGDGVIRSAVDSFIEESVASGGISGVWIVIVDKGWCLLRAGGDGVEVRSGGGDVREDVVKKVKGVGERIRDTLLPIQPVE